MRLLKRKSWALLAAVAVALFLAMATATQSARAQEPLPPTDLSIDLKYYGFGEDSVDEMSWIIVLTNQGGRDVYSGQVKVSVTPQFFDTDVILHVWEIDPEHGYFDEVKGIWHFRNLPAGQSTKLRLGSKFQNHPAGIHTYNHLVVGRAEIVSSLPREDSMFLYNNATAEHWRSLSAIGYRAAHANGDVGVANMQVNNRFPRKDDAVNFTVGAENEDCSNKSGARQLTSKDVHEVRVELGLSPGLELVSAQAPGGTTFNSLTGVWDVGRLSGTCEPGNVNSREMPVSVRYTGAVPLEDACLTAELVNVIPPEHPDPANQRNNKVRACLGEDPTVLLREGETELLHMHPCVGATAYPCNDIDTVELLGRMRNHVLPHDSGIGRYDIWVANDDDVVFLQPETIVLHVEDT